MSTKFNSDGEALAFLESQGFKQKDGHITFPPGHDPSTKEWDALTYLWDEWDYSSGPEGGLDVL